MKKDELLRRYVVFGGALFVCASGVSLITRSVLGTSPISSIPFVWSLFTPLSMGTYIFILNMLLIAGQLWMLGLRGIRERRLDLALQIPVSVLFGLFVDLTMALLGDYRPEAYMLKVASLTLGCVVLAAGICLEVAADVTMLSGEYFVQIASRRFGKEFGLVKITFDCSLVVIAALCSLALGGRIEGLREGTVLAALLTGPFVRMLSPLTRGVRRLLAASEPVAEEPQPRSSGLVVTIAREYGSGGHDIGRLLAERLGIAFYDNALIGLVAEESGFSEAYVSRNEQHLPNGQLYRMIVQDYAVPLDRSLSPEDALFVAQSRVIRRLASQGSCVIVGRCADYILRDYPNCIHLFLHADRTYKVERAVGEYGLSPERAAAEVDRINASRAAHYAHYTDRRWDDLRHYHLTCDTGLLSAGQICAMIEALCRRIG